VISLASGAVGCEGGGKKGGGSREGGKRRMDEKEKTKKTIGNRYRGTGKGIR